MKDDPFRQLDLFAAKPRNFDEAALIRLLKEAVDLKAPGLMSAATRRRLMTPLPPITVPR